MAKFSLNDEFSVMNSCNYGKNHLIIFTLALALIVFIFSYGVGTSSAVSGDIIYVNSHGNDSWNGGNEAWNGVSGPKLTIKNATRCVNNGGTIEIADGIYSGNRNTKVTINKNMKINGQSKDGSIINGKGINWIFKINPGVTVTITNLTINLGKSVNAGGAVNNYGILTVKNTNFANNTAYGGGAINNYINSNLKVEGCSFKDNTATIGGAVENAGKMVVSGSNFNDNTAKYGGAIDNADNVTVIGSSFVNNKASDSGGAISNFEGNMYCHFNQLVGNTANNGPSIMYGLGTADLSFNWWSSNSGPLNNVVGNAIISPWLILNITANPIYINNSNSIISANLLYDSNNGYHDPIYGHISNGIPVKFTTSLGIINSPVLMVNGVSQSILNTNEFSGLATISAMVDSQIVNINVTIDPKYTKNTLNQSKNLLSTNPTKVSKLTFSKSNNVENMQIQNSDEIQISHIGILNKLFIYVLTNPNYILRININTIMMLSYNSFKDISTILMSIEQLLKSSIQLFFSF